MDSLQNLQKIHLEVSCKICNKKPIIGIRWFCFTCRQKGIIYNVCDTCNHDHIHKLDAIDYSSGDYIAGDPREP